MLSHGLINRKTRQEYDERGKPISSQFEFKTKPTVKPRTITIKPLPVEKKSSGILSKFEEFVIYGQTFARRMPAVWTTAMAFVASQIPAVAADGYVCSTDVPPGGSSICPSGTLGCLEGYISSNTTKVLLAQFNRLVSPVTGQKQNSGAYSTLKECMTMDKVCAMVQQLYQDSKDTSKTTPASGMDTQWDGYQMSSSVTELPIDTATLYQGLFGAQAQDCHSATAVVENNLIGLVGLIALIIPIACCVYAYQKYVGDPAAARERADENRSADEAIRQIVEEENARRAATRAAETKTAAPAEKTPEPVPLETIAVVPAKAEPELANVGAEPKVDDAPPSYTEATHDDASSTASMRPM